LKSNSALSYEERGEGVPLVLVHGFPFDHSIWRSQLDSMGEGVRVLVPDLPGFGQSAPLPDTEPTMPDYANQLALWAGEVGLDKFVLVGHSMGGYIAFAFARGYAHMLSGLGLVCTRPGPDTEQAKQGRYTQIAQVWDRGPQAVVDAMLPRLFSPRTKDANPGLVEQVRELMLRQNPEGIVSALRAMASRPDSFPMLEKIQVPTLVVSGLDDAIIPAEEADLMAATIPGARQERIDGAGHMLMMEQAGSLTEMLRDLARGSLTNPQPPEPPSPQDIAGARTRD
jgi:3-oxoadipate enol-lactonase